MFSQVESPPLPQLSSEERARLHTLERTIERGLANFLEVGKALLEIRDQRLYRAHGSFEQYCHQRFGITQHRGLAIIRSTQVADHLLAGPASPEGDAPLPADLAEQSLRPLHRVDPELAAQIWRLASRLGKPTGPVVGRIVRVVEEAIHQDNGVKQPEPNHPQKQTFLPSIYRLAGNDGFCPQVILTRIETPEQARRCATSCRILINRCQAILNEIEHQFPEL